MKECNKAVKGEFKLHTKLEGDWGLYEFKGQKVLFKKNIAKSKKDLSIERLLLFKKHLEKVKRENYIRSHTRPPR